MDVIKTFNKVVAVILEFILVIRFGCPNETSKKSLLMDAFR
jgi:hypothetical protein